MGGVVAVLVSGLTDWEQVVFYSWVMIKTVEDHAGYELPFSPLIILARYTGAGVTYHNVHHQTWGLKVCEFPPVPAQEMWTNHGADQLCHLLFLLGLVDEYRLRR